MKKIICCALCMLSLQAWGQAGVLSPGTPVQTANGEVTGVAGELEGITAFKGIPFAAPPVGDLRWRPAQPAADWEGVLSADAFGSPCMQPSQLQRTPNNVSVDLPDSPPVSEDCLYLNVWTPAQQADEKLPVMVWIFGGAYTEGAGSSPHNQGDPLASQGVLMVSLNYRLSSLGFLAHPELTAESPHGASGNYALSDALAALQWVQDNIEAFGGDPDNVTIFGESAGSAIVAALVGSPQAAGLFDKAIAESGTWMGLNIAPMRSRESAEQQTLEVAQELGAEDLAALRAMSAEEALEKLPAQGMIVDGWIVPEDLSLAFAEGRQNPVALIVGSNRDEGSFAAGFAPPMTAENWQSGAEQRWGELAEQGLAAYPAATDEEAAAQNNTLFTDNMAWISRLFAASQRDIGQPAYVYHFIHEPPYAASARNLGVCHTCEMPYVLRTLDKPRVYPDASSPELAAGSAVEHAVSDIASGYWLNFAKTGDPNGEGLPQWPVFEGMLDGPVLHIDAEPEVADSLGEAKVDFYQGLYEARVESQL